MKTHHLVGMLAELIVILLATPSLFADETVPAAPEIRKNYLAADIGPVFGVGRDAGNTHFTYGGRLDAGLFADPSGILSLGLYVASFTDSAAVQGVSANDRVTLLAAEILTRRAFGTGLFLGGRFGVGLINLNIATPSVLSSGTGASFTAGPVLGYEVQILDQLSIAADLSWISIGSATIAMPLLGALQFDSGSAILSQLDIGFHF